MNPKCIRCPTEEDQGPPTCRSRLSGTGHGIVQPPYPLCKNIVTSASGVVDTHVNKHTQACMSTTYNSTSETNHLKEIKIFNSIQQGPNILYRDNILGYILIHHTSKYQAKAENKIRVQIRGKLA